MKPFKIITAVYAVLIFLMSVTCVALGSPENTYLRVGPHKDTMCITVRIDMWWKYVFAQAWVFLFSAFQTYRETSLYPWVMNHVYDNKQIHILEYSPSETTIIVNINYICDKVWYILGVWITISQVDFALFSALSSCIMNYIVVKRQYISSKKFILSPLLPKKETDFLSVDLDKEENNNDSTFSNESFVECPE